MGDALAFDVFNPDCPSRVILQRVGNRWTVLVILHLADGPLRFSALAQALGSISPKVLTETLRMLERDGLIARRAYVEIPPRVEYSLTSLGRSLIGPLEQLRLWAEGHAGSIIAAREAFDDAQAAVAHGN